MDTTLTFGERLRNMEARFNKKPVEMARWLGISENDYYGVKYRKNERSPNATWNKLLFAVEQFGWIWLFWTHFEPLSNEEIQVISSDANEKLSAHDYWITKRPYSQVRSMPVNWGQHITSLSVSIINFKSTGKWESEFDHYYLHDLWIHLAVSWQDKYSGKTIQLEDDPYEGKYFLYTVRLLRTLIQEGIRFDAPEFARGYNFIR